MAELDHPLRAEVAALREVIRGVDPEITQQIKWNAPSFSCAGAYIATFNLRSTDRVHLIFHNPRIAEVSSELLEGNYPDRRMAYFANLADVHAKSPELERIVAEVVRFNRKASEVGR